MVQDRVTCINAAPVKLLSAAMEQCRASTALVSPDGRFQWANEAFARIYGYRRAELLRTHLVSLFSSDNMLALAAADRELRQTGEFAGEVRNLRKDGTEFVALLHACFVTDENREASGVLLVVQDLAETKLAEQILRLSREELARRCAALETVAQRGAQRLKEVESELSYKAGQLQRAEQALGMILTEKHERQRRLEKNVHDNLTAGVFPIIDQLKSLKLPESAHLLIQSLESGLNNVFRWTRDCCGDSESRLTLRELHVCKLIRSGLTTKQIAAVMGVSSGTVTTHRTNIRKKLGLVGAQDNLSAYLKNNI